MITTKERAKGHYEVRKSAFATDYVWVPGEEELERRLDVEEALHPWHADYEEWARGQRTHPEEQNWIELEAL
jgi:hypothetical protein